MRFNDRYNKFTDLDQLSHLRPPNVVVRADDISYNALIAAADLYQSEPRRVIYADVNNAKRYLECRPYVHPTGAAALVVGTLATAADGTVTFTPTVEGRLVSETGVLVPTAGAPQRGDAIAGMLFTDMFIHVTDEPMPLETFRVIQLNAGDFCWLVRRGDVDLDASGAVANGAKLRSSTTVAGEVEASPALDTTSVTTLSTTLQSHLLDPEYFALGVAKAAIAGAGLVRAFLDLPHHYNV